MFVDMWVRRDGKEGARYYCADHARTLRIAYLRCVWPGCKAPVVAVIHEAPVCAVHREIEETRR